MRARKKVKQIRLLQYICLHRRQVNFFFSSFSSMKAQGVLINHLTCKPWIKLTLKMKEEAAVAGNLYSHCCQYQPEKIIASKYKYIYYDFFLKTITTILLKFE